MSKRTKCKPIEDWVQLALIPEAQRDLIRLGAILRFRELDSFKNYLPRDDWYPRNETAPHPIDLERWIADGSAARLHDAMRARSMERTSARSQHATIYVA